MLISQKPDIPRYEITSESHYLNRRSFVAGAAAGVALLGTGQALGSIGYAGVELGGEVTPESIVTSHNNFYEFGTGKSDPSEHAHQASTQRKR